MRGSDPIILNYARGGQPRRSIWFDVPVFIATLFACGLILGLFFGVSRFILTPLVSIIEDGAGMPSKVPANAELIVRGFDFVTRYYGWTLFLIPPIVLPMLAAKIRGGMPHDIRSKAWLLRLTRWILTLFVGLTLAAIATVYAATWTSAINNTTR